MSNKPPAFQFYVKDWRSSPTVQLMSREERGTYIDLLALAWENEALLPGDVHTLARSMFGYNVRSLANFLAKFPECFVKVRAKFGESLVNLKLREQYEEVEHYKQNQSDAGKKGNEVRWGKESQANRSASAFASAPASANTTPAAQVAAFTLPDWIPSDAWDGFIETRIRIRSKPTPYSVRLLIKKLQKLKAEGQDVRAVLEQSIERSWRGLFAVDTERKNGFKRAGDSTQDHVDRLRRNAEALGLGRPS